MKAEHRFKAVLDTHIWISAALSQSGACGSTFRDPDDDAFIHAAIASEARWLISGDRDLLTVKPIEGLRNCTPAQPMQVFGIADA